MTTMLRIALALLAILIAAPAIEPVPTAEAAGDAQARRGNRGVRKQPVRKVKRRKKPKLRADKGDIRPDRSPMRARVATGERRSKFYGRSDTSKLPFKERAAQQIEEVLKSSLRAGTTSIHVADADTGKAIFSVYPDDPLNPASNVKLIATAAALDLMGPDFRYRTRILGEAPDDSGVLASDLYLLGTYDPTLNRAALDDMVRQLADAGLRRLDGDVVVGETRTRDAMYIAYTDLLIVAANPGEPPIVSMNPPVDYLQVEVTATTSAKKRPRRPITIKQSVITDEQGRQRVKVVVGGEIGRHQTLIRDVWPNARNVFTAHVLRSAMRDAGIEVTGDVRISELRPYLDEAFAAGFLPVPLAEHESQRLADIVARINKRSTNWLADRVIMTAAAFTYGGLPSLEKAQQAMYAWLDSRTGLGRDDLVVDRPSGLSYKTELSARQVVKVLRAGLGYEGVSSERDAINQQAYRESLAIGGVDGTIRRRFKRLDALVLGKTGTLKRVISLAGVIEVSPERRLVFSIITNGHDPSWKHTIRRGQDQIVKILCDYLHWGMPKKVEAPELELEPDDAVVDPEELELPEENAEEGEDVEAGEIELDPEPTP
jgi:D-alanyl-D-alanine carboxypeptidase/D-alanyl-D-alanine-endopeptidase (penicillin-binding protein 4)